MVFPLLMALLFAMIQFSMVLSARQHVQAASREAARLVAHGGDPGDAENLVIQSLNSAGLGNAAVVVGKLDNSGKLNSDPNLIFLSGDLLAVEVTLPIHSAAPDLLGFLGLNFLGDDIVARTVMTKE